MNEDGSVSYRSKLFSIRNVLWETIKAIKKIIFQSLQLVIVKLRANSPPFNKKYLFANMVLKNVSPSIWLKSMDHKCTRR